MPGTFGYTESTNTVVVTGGTSGSPADFASFVTADRAGTATLLAATAGLSPTLALTYQIRPVEDMALLITFTVAAKTAEADYIFITGTDFAGNAQTEAIDVTAGNGAYVSTKYFRTITNIDCSDNAAGGGTQWADGTVAVTQPQWGVIWDNGSGQYIVDCDFNIGDASTPTYFTSLNENVQFGTKCPQTTASATLQVGAPSNDYSSDSCYWRFTGTNWTRAVASGATASWLIYGSVIKVDGTYALLNGGSNVIKNSVLIGHSSSAGGFTIWTGCAAITLVNVYLVDMAWFGVAITPTVFEKISVESLKYGYVHYSNLPNGAIYDLTMTNIVSTDVWNNSDSTISLIDPTYSLGTPIISDADGVVKEQYTCNITVADKDGTLLDGVEVLCEDKDDAQAFTTTTGDTDTGKIDEQVITYKTWTGTSETLTTQSPHKFTLSKAGYETLVLDNITVDSPIDWHLELQDYGFSMQRVRIGH